jgi:phosphate transport system substrate-binding protein
MKFNKTYFLPLLLSAVCLGSCSHNQMQGDNARFTSDDASIAVDESLQPIVDQELYIFKASDKKLNPKAIYAPENEVFNLLLADSVRFAMTARDLTKAEYSDLAARNLHPIVSRFAIDAIAIIVNKASADTGITVSELKKMLNGQGPANKNIIFDNPNSGLVRYLKAFSGNSDLKGKNIFSLKSNKEVIEYVAQHPDALGVTGFSWLNDPDKDYAAAVDNVRTLSVKDDSPESKDSGYYAPSQTTLALKQYPLTRDLYIVNSTGFKSMEKKFADLVKGERGQLIVLRSGLLPDDIPDRQINIVK